MNKWLRFTDRAGIMTRVLASHWAIVVVLLLAAGVRVWQLNYHSVWFDEAVSLQWARSDPAFIWQKTFPLVEEKHPPVYFLGLHYWRAALGWIGLGNHDAALRLFGSLLGVATVWGIMLLARRLSGNLVGLLTGIFVALASVLVWYSQELRMFQPATTGLVWGAYCLWRAWEAETHRRALGWWIGMVSAFTLALYSYLFSAFLLPAAGFTLLALPFLAKRPDRWQRFTVGVIALAITGLLFLPWPITPGSSTAAKATPATLLPTPAPPSGISCASSPSGASPGPNPSSLPACFCLPYLSYLAFYYPITQSPNLPTPSPPHPVTLSPCLPVSLPPCLASTSSSGSPFPC